ATAHARIVPAPEFFHGLVTLLWFSDRVPSYALGQMSPSGKWYFFPLAIGVKTPIAFLVLALVGAAATVQGMRGERRRSLGIPLVATLAIVGIAMTSDLAMGLRYVLPVYPFLSVLMGVGAISLWQTRRAQFPARAAVMVLGGWLIAASIRAH